MSEKWYALQTKPRCEEPVYAKLRRHCGLHAFLPRLAVPQRRGERCVAALKIMFPSYVFVRMPSDPHHWHTVQWMPGVRTFVGIGGLPVPVPADAIQMLQARCLSGDVIPWGRSLTAGTSVRIVQGPLSGLIGILERPTTQRERVRVLLTLLGRQLPVEVDAVDLEETI